MKSLQQFITEGKPTLEEEMKEWEERFRSPFGQALKELQWTINDKGLYAPEKNEYGFYVFTPFDNYVTAYALDGNKEYTFKKVKQICYDYDFSEHEEVEIILNKLEKLVNEESK